MLWGAHLVGYVYEQCTPWDCHGQDIDSPHIDTDGYIAEMNDTGATLYTVIEESETRRTLAQLIRFGGNKVGTVTGQALYAIGDVYSLVTTSGNLVASESENFQPITHAATLYDWNNQETGRLEERFVALTPTVDIIHTTSNGSYNITGTATTVFASLTHQTTLTLP